MPLYTLMTNALNTDKKDSHDIPRILSVRQQDSENNLFIPINTS